MGAPYIYPVYLVLLAALTVFAAVRASTPTRSRNATIAIAVGAWLVALVFMTVRPGTGLGVRLNLLPLIVDGPQSAFDALKNFFVFLPFGMLLATIGWRFLAALAAALLVSLTVEITQYFTDWGRTADVNDLITNGAGAALGWLVAWAIGRAVTRRELPAVEPAETLPLRSEPAETSPKVY